MFCDKCGSPLKEGAKFCHNCRAEVCVLIKEVGFFEAIRLYWKNYFNSKGTASTNEVSFAVWFIILGYIFCVMMVPISVIIENSVDYGGLPIFVLAIPILFLLWTLINLSPFITLVTRKSHAVENMHIATKSKATAIINRRLVIIAVTMSVATLALGIFLFFYNLGHTWPATRRAMEAYYGDDANYITVEAIIDSSHVNEYSGNRYLKVTLLNDSIDEDIKNIFSWGYLVILEANDVILQNHEFEATKGKIYTFTIAPRTFYHGDNSIKVAHISDENKTYLDFETGKANILEWVKTTP